jgi:hypothetical protein
MTTRVRQSRKDRRQRVAESVRLCRHRKRNGRAVLKVEVDVGTLADLLIDAGFLAAWDADDRGKLRQALECAVQVWARP